jgi:hypothetical protein
MAQGTHPVPAPSRRLRLWLDLIDAKGLDTSYKLLPRKPMPDQSAAIRLIKTDEWSGENVEVYDVIQDNAGNLTCTCPGHRAHGHCKHAEALAAAQVLLPGERQLLQEIGRTLADLKAEAEAKVAELNWQLSAAQRDLAAARQQITELQAELASRPARSQRKTRSLRKAIEPPTANAVSEEVVHA